MSIINEIIRGRRSVYPPQYINKPIPNEIVQALLINANHAPTHRLTEPWRFRVFTDEGKRELGAFLAKKYKETSVEFMQSKFDKIIANAEKAGVILAIMLHRDPKARVPEWEEIAATACAVQNIWISLDQYGLGGYWSTPEYGQFLGEHILLEANETCLGFFYIGYCDPSDRVTPKGPIEEKTKWINR